MIPQNFVVNDTNAKLRIRGRRLDGTIIDNAGSAYTLKYRINNGALQSKTMTNEVTGTDPITGGFAYYTFLSTELSVAGQLKGEVEILNASKVVSNSLPFIIPIRAKV